MATSDSCSCHRHSQEEQLRFTTPLATKLSISDSSGYGSRKESSASLVPLFKVSLLSQQDGAHVPAKKTIIQNWPDTPTLLRRGASLNIFSVFGDLILLAFWYGLVVLAVLIARNHGVTHDNVVFGDNQLSQAKIVIPTLFPIIFAATIGRSIRLFSMYRLEQGERLGILDQLLGSTSFIGTLVTATSVSGASFITVALLAVWVLSPLGGQATFRSFYWQANLTEAPAIFQYLGPNNTFNIPRGNFTVDGNTLFATSLISPEDVTHSPMDLWGNVKIPSLEALASITNSSEDGWYYLSPNANVTRWEYASLLGIPIQKSGFLDGSSRFLLESSYWTLECPMIAAWSASQMNDWTQDWRYKYTDGSQLLTIYTNRPDDIDSKKYSPSLERRRLLFQITHRTTVLAGCFIQTSYVEAEVLCRKTMCATARIRESRQPYRSKNYTLLDDEDLPSNLNRSRYFENFVSSLPHNSDHISALTTYIARSLRTPADLDVHTFYSDVIENPAPFVFSLAQALNTYWTAISATSWILDPSGSNYSPHLAQDYSGFPIDTRNASAWVWSEEPIFTCSKAWLALLFIAVLVPFIACLVNIALASYLKGPHLSMNFSTLTRDNPFLGIPPGGSALSDHDRSKLSRNVRIRYGDVTSNADVGRIAIGAADDGHDDFNGVWAKKLERSRNRLYD